MADSSDHLTTEGAWHSWKRWCAAALCPDDEARQLRRFGRFRFLQMHRKVAVSPLASSGEPTDLEHAWHLFETYCQAGPGRKGKAYKKWLFARTQGYKGSDWLERIEAGASLLMRDVVRDHVRREQAGRFMKSFQTPVGDTGCTLEELLPAEECAPMDLLTRREWESLARPLATFWFNELDRRERLLVLAREYGLSFAHPLLEKNTGTAKTFLYDVYRRVVERMADHLRENYPDESPEGWRFMARNIMENVAAQSFFHFLPEKGLSRFLRVLKVQPKGVSRG